MISASSASAPLARVGVDVGGTFTDAVLELGGRLFTAKVPSTPEDQSIGVLAGVMAALDVAGLATSDIGAFAHGMTVGTNALLEGKGATTALIATEGFGDVLELRRQNRAHLYRLSEAHAPPLVSREMVVEADERFSASGLVRDLSATALKSLVQQITERAPEAIAVGLLFSFAHPEHEQRIVEALRTALPGVHVSASSDVLPEIREYERISTTVVDAYLTPVLRRYLESLEARAVEAGLPAPSIMQSNGGVLDIGASSEHAAWMVLSGPAAGVIGAADIAGTVDAPLLLTFDMGGTSCDVALVRDGEPARTSETVIAGYPLSLPMLDIETVSAGGGSIAWMDSGGALRVGPHSAGAQPGPAAYGHGGTEPTVTDANLVLGRLDADATFGGAIALDLDAASTAVESLATRLGLDLEACASGIIRVANEEMVRALRRVSVERGVDPRNAALLAFGGAGPLHAADVSDALGVRTVIVPPAAGLLAALGLIVAGQRRDYVQTVLRDAWDVEGLRRDLVPLEGRAESELPGAEHRVSVDCRYAGQAFSLTVPWDVASATTLLDGFHELHRERYGDGHPERPVEAVSLRVAAVRPGVSPDLSSGAPEPLGHGPSRLPIDGATCWIGADWSARRDGSGTIYLERV